MTFFIAEVSSNHSKDLDKSLKFIDTAAEIGCDAVKFQLFKVSKLFSPEILEKSKEHRERSRWELPLEFLPELKKRCKERNIQFSCTPFYLEAVEEIKPFVDFYKIASYELLWDELLEACSITKKPIILSTGMATIEEVKHAVDVITKKGSQPKLLHCTSAYPTPHNQANLAAIETLRKETGCEVGWSDHTVEPAVLYRAVLKWGAKFIEFHLDIDGKGEEFGTGHCWLPKEISEVINTIKTGEESDGLGKKEPVFSEIEDRNWRADPEDGLRPLKKIRASWKPDN